MKECSSARRVEISSALDRRAVEALSLELARLARRSPVAGRIMCIAKAKPRGSR